MTSPYQCLAARESTETGPGGWTLFGAYGSTLVAQSSSGGTSTWTKPDDVVAEPEPKEQKEEKEEEQPPQKKVKLSQPPKSQKTNFSNLTVSSDGRYIVGVTGEDKCIRVFETDIENQIRQLSERHMTRRPCSIALTSDDSTILCADKFGDVYSLPLLPSPDYRAPEAPEEPVQEAEWVPAATVLTVHSGRNRQTLENQLKQKKKGPAPPKDEMKFEHQLLLGHVSMLTDIVNARTDDNRSYIITADRDEHIRVSRGIPQAHIIEGFCFGHEAFINRLCLTQSGRLVSGGGDPYLYVWDWQNYKLLKKLPILDAVVDHLKSRPELEASEITKVAVSGIWSVPHQNEVLVACEGIPALFSFKVDATTTTSSATTEYSSALALKGNALDVAFLPISPTSSAVVVSIDNVHKPASIKEVRVEKEVHRLQCFSSQENGKWQEDAHTSEALKSFREQVFDVEAGAIGGDGSATGNGQGGLGSADDKALRDMLYSVENLRKRPGAED
ncbi:tRNA (guanine-N(7)-)-methyltransferase non-catalytic subunit trm82 [Didymella pomorum]|uniref:tRNA (Guanine-N(7)-)-methyltransferase non-catalytic subunit trm82 n=1 Tax=Didymella pomorum TaxID=749634 RepID=A0A9W8ZB07_9PLEO|nr:tRNA (guanine-N(7)-)-methyltransferase non-catalytic subunit trm82 [Didymella pomorum]